MKQWSLVAFAVENWKRKRLKLSKKADGKVVVIKEVPALVCQQCGERYFSIDTVEHVNLILKEVSEQKVKRQKILAGKLDFKAVAL